MFVFGHYVDYPQNQSSAEPVSPNPADNQEFTVTVLRCLIKTEMGKIKLQVYHYNLSLSEDNVCVRSWILEDVWLVDDKQDVFRLPDSHSGHSGNLQPNNTLNNLNT